MVEPQTDEKLCPHRKSWIAKHCNDALQVIEWEEEFLPCYGRKCVQYVSCYQMIEVTLDVKEVRENG